MARQTTNDLTAGADRITFKVEQLEHDQPGRVVVRGRWFGVRGRRFVRPTLTLTLRTDSSERRALADLEHKPWAAEDGARWVAAFPIDVKLEDVAQLELSVAPDVAVELAEAPGTPRGRGATVSAAPDARAPRIRSDRVPARPSAGDREQEIERLRSRATTAEWANEREHARRQESDRALEEARSESLRLRSELGRLRAELDIAATARGELSAASAELDAARTDARDTSRRLQEATRALDLQRAESERLRLRLTAAEATVERLTRARDTERRHAAAAADPRPESERPRAAGRTADPPTEHHDAAAETDGPASEPDDRTARVAGEERVGSQAPAYAPAPPRGAADPGGAARRGRPDYVRSERPVNPALRSRPNWLGRLLALIVILAVIAAIVLVIRSTIA